MNEIDRIDTINGLVEYFAKNRRNEGAENAMRQMLSSLPDEQFDEAVSKLYTVSNRYGLDLSAIKAALAEISASADDSLPKGYERVGNASIIHKGVEVRCDCCGHHYLWSQTADEQDSADKDWWTCCPLCGFDSDVQASAHRDIERTGKIPPVYIAMLERQYRRYAERDFNPIRSRALVRETLKTKRQQDWRLVQKLMIELQSHMACFISRARTGRDK
jgi:hypothetical protein